MYFCWTSVKISPLPTGKPCQLTSSTETDHLVVTIPKEKKGFKNLSVFERPLNRNLQVKRSSPQEFQFFYNSLEEILGFKKTIISDTTPGIIVGVLGWSTLSQSVPDGRKHVYLFPTVRRQPPRVSLTRQETPEKPTIVSRKRS